MMGDTGGAAPTAGNGGVGTGGFVKYANPPLGKLVLTAVPLLFEFDPLPGPDMKAELLVSMKKGAIWVPGRKLQSALLETTMHPPPVTGL